MFRKIAATILLIPALALCDVTSMHLAVLAKKKAGGGGGGAVTYDAYTHSSDSGTTVTSFSFSHSIGGGVTDGLVVVTVSWHGTTTPASDSVTVGGNTATAVSGAEVSHGFGSTKQYYYATGSTTGSVTIAGSWTGAADVFVTAESFSNVDQTTPIDGGVSLSAVSGGAQRTITVSSETDDMTLAVFVQRSAGGAATVDDQTSNYTTNNTGDLNDHAGSVASGAASNSHNFTPASSLWTRGVGVNINHN